MSTPSNIRWLTSFGGSLGWVVVGPDRCSLVTDGRYAERAAADLAAAGLADAVDVVVGTTRPQIRDHVVALAGADAVRQAEADHLTHAEWLDLATDLTLTPDAGTIVGLRRTKDAGELARMAHAAEIADAALAEVAPMLADGPTEADVRDELEYRMRQLGADRPSYDTIVASGPDNAARPHHQTGHRTIVEGDTVIIDVGALVDGYHSDMTRSFVVGDPTREQQDDLRPRARGPARRPRTRSAPASRPRTSTPSAGTCSPTAATATGTSTAPATASASTSTRTPSRRRCRPRSCWSGTW